MDSLYNELSGDLLSGKVRLDGAMLNISEAVSTRETCLAMRCLATEFSIPHSLVFEPPISAAIGAAAAGAAQTE